MAYSGTPALGHLHLSAADLIAGGTFIFIPAPATGAQIIPGSTFGEVYTFATLPFGARADFDMRLGPFFSFAATSVDNAVSGNTTYHGTFPASPSLVGFVFTTSSFAQAANNGVFICVGFTTSTLVLANPNGVSDTTGNLNAIGRRWTGPIPLVGAIDQTVSVFVNRPIALGIDSAEAPLANTTGQPLYLVMDPADGGPIASATVTFGGTGYNVGDVGVFQSSNNSGTYTVATTTTAVISGSSLNAGGVSYAPGDTGTVTTGSADATYIVNTVDGGGAVLTYTLTSAGTAYVTGTNISTATGGGQPGVGTGLTLDITAGSGAVLTVTVLDPGFPYFSADTPNLSPTTGHGDGDATATITIGALGDGSLDVYMPYYVVNS